jgi:hypothetical protein
MDHLPDELFADMANLSQIDCRVLRLVAKRFQTLPRVGPSRQHVFAGCIEWGAKSLAKWYYDQSPITISLQSLYIQKSEWLANYLYSLPEYIYDDNPGLAIQKEFITSYIEIYGVKKYIDVLMTLKCNIYEWSLWPTGCHKIACKLVYKCTNVGTNYLVMVTLVGLLNAPTEIVKPVIINSDYINQLSAMQLRMLAFMTLCRRNIRNYRHIDSLFIANNHTPCAEIRYIAHYMTVFGLTDTVYKLMDSLYNDIVKETSCDLCTHVYHKYFVTRDSNYIYS